MKEAGNGLFLPTMVGTSWKLSSQGTLGSFEKDEIVLSGIR